MSDDGLANISLEYPPSDLSLPGYPPLSAADREALTRSLMLARREDVITREQIDTALIEKGYASAAKYGCYCRQDRALQLKPWETPICWIRTAEADLDALIKSLPKGPDQCGYRRAALLLRRLLRHGLSRFEPDPLNAIERAEAEAKKRRPKSNLSDSDIPPSAQI
jgi:hypothetical protein